MTTAHVQFDRSGGQRRRWRAADLPGMLFAPRLATPRSPRVLLASRLTALAAPGGGETQLAALAGALPEVGVEARLWRPWEDQLAEFDCLHLFGSLPEHLATVAAARQHNMPIALSPIAWFDLASRWHDSTSLPRRLVACSRHLARCAWPRFSNWRRRLYHQVDLLLPNSQAEASQLMRLFGVPAERIRVVPNGADVRFAQADPQPFTRLVSRRPFVLYAGRIEPRKNQLGFLRAMHGSGIPVVVLGDVVPGHEPYLAACHAAADGDVRFVPALAHDDPMLASAYAACGCLALASWFETPGLVALEAAMTGTPLVLTDRGPTREYFGELACYVSPASPGEMREAVCQAIRQPRDPRLASLVRERYRWSAAARATREAYDELL